LSPKVLAIFLVSMIATVASASASTYSLQCGQLSDPNAVTLTINTDSQTVTVYSPRLGRSYQYSTTAFTDSEISLQEPEPNGQVTYMSLNRQSGMLTVSLGSATVSIACK